MTLIELVERLLCVRKDIEWILDEVRSGITGEIRLPPVPQSESEKKPRKKRIRKVRVMLSNKVDDFAPPRGEPSIPDAKEIIRKMRTKEEMARASVKGVDNLPDADKGNTFYEGKRWKKGAEVE